MSWIMMARKSWKDWIAVLVLLACLAGPPTVCSRSCLLATVCVQRRVLWLPTEFATAVTEETGVGRHMYITDTMLEQIKFPFGKSTVPSWSVPLYNLVGPPVVIAVHAQVTNRPSVLSHHGILGALFSTSTSALITNILKITVSRPAPPLSHSARPTFASPRGHASFSSHMHGPAR